VSGTLRDQLLYPQPPRAVWAEADDETRQRFEALEGPGAGARREERDEDEEEREERLSRCLEAVELDYLLGRSGLAAQ
jgi:hypothetical protein